MEFVAINPVIVESKGGTVNDREGCLSFPGPVPERPPGQDGEGAGLRPARASSTRWCAHDLPARVWQHEIDHLHGVLFIDKMGSLGLHRSQKDLEKFIADFEKDKKKGELPPGLEPKL